MFIKMFINIYCGALQTPFIMVMLVIDLVFSEYNINEQSFMITTRKKKSKK